MKRSILVAASLLLLAATGARAQKVNKDALLQKIEKSDSDSSDAKKGAKASTWISRGKAYLEAATEPTKALYVGMEEMMVPLTLGMQPNSVEEVTIAGNPFKALNYNYVTIYLRNGKVVAWKEVQTVAPGLVEEAIASYRKASELDPKLESKVREGLTSISNYCSHLGSVSFDIAEYGRAADAFSLAFEAQSVPAYGKPDLSVLYNAGLVATIDGTNNPASYARGQEYLTKALEMGYTDEGGDIYYYLFHDYYGQKEQNPENVLKAKAVLLEGIAKFPRNEKILEGLMSLYTAEEGVGDPADLITLIDEAIAREPQNSDLWFGRARIFIALKSYDEAIEALTKVVELNPDAFDSNFYLGYFITVKGDNFNTEMSSKSYNSYEESNADLKKRNEIYAQAVPYLEKANKLNPADLNTVELLKQISFTLRDDPEFEEKYVIYNKMYKDMQGQE